MMGKQWKQCQTLFFLGSKITAEGDCSHEIKRAYSSTILWDKYGLLIFTLKFKRVRPRKTYMMVLSTEVVLLVRAT